MQKTSSDIPELLLTKLKATPPLNQLRNNQITADDLSILNKYVRTNFDATKEEGYITLSTHNSKADLINSKALEALKEKEWNYASEITGEYPEHELHEGDVIILASVGAGMNINAVVYKW